MRGPTIDVVDHLSVLSAALLALVALLAGAINAIAGGGSLLTFPALLAAGLSPVSANVTNTVSLVPGYMGGIAGFRHDLPSQGQRVRMLLPAAFAGSLLGAIVLLTTSAAVFKHIVPVLVLIAAIVLLLQPMLQKRLGRLHPETGEPLVRENDTATVIAVFLAAVYGGYFGAVLGIILLAVLGTFLPDDLHRLNALKSVLQFATNIIAVVVFAIFGPVQWLVVLLMAPMSLAGGWLGSRLSRRVHPKVLRAVIGVYGVGAAVILAITLR